MNVNTKPVPIVIVLLAAASSCILSILQQAPFDVFFKRLLVTVLIFAVVGITTKIVLDKVFGNGKEEPEEEEEPQEEDGFVESEDMDGEEPSPDMENVELPTEPEDSEGSYGVEFIDEVQGYLDGSREEGESFENEGGQEQEEAS